MPTSQKRNQRRALTLALIGAGRWGSNIRRTLADIPGCTLKYIETHNWRRLLRLPDLDGILVATPASTHAEIALPFIRRGIPTFIEKPLTTTLEDALQLARAARRAKSLVFVGHVHLYNPAYEAVRKLLPRLGGIRFLVSEGMNNGPFRTDMSALWDWAPHDLALAFDLLQKRPIAVQASAASVLRPRTRLHDVAMLTVRFKGGASLFGMYSWLAPEKRKCLTIVGTKSTVVFDDAAKHKVSFYEHLGPAAHRGTVVRQEPHVTHPSYGATPSLTAEMSAFLTMIRTKRPPRSPLSQGIQIVEILAAADRSIRAGGREVPPKRPRTYQRRLRSYNR